MNKLTSFAYIISLLLIFPQMVFCFSKAQSLAPQSSSYADTRNIIDTNLRPYYLTLANISNTTDLEQISLLLDMNGLDPRHIDDLLQTVRSHSGQWYVVKNSYNKSEFYGAVAIYPVRLESGTIKLVTRLYLIPELNGLHITEYGREMVSTIVQTTLILKILANAINPLINSENQEEHPTKLVILTEEGDVMYHHSLAYVAQNHNRGFLSSDAGNLFQSELFLPTLTQKVFEYSVKVGIDTVSRGINNFSLMDIWVNKAGQVSFTKPRGEATTLYENLQIQIPFALSSWLPKFNELMPSRFYGMDENGQIRFNIVTPDQANIFLHQFKNGDMKWGARDFENNEITRSIPLFTEASQILPFLPGMTSDQISINDKNVVINFQFVHYDVASQSVVFKGLRENIVFELNLLDHRGHPSKNILNWIKNLMHILTATDSTETRSRLMYRALNTDIILGSIGANREEILSQNGNALSLLTYLVDVFSQNFSDHDKIDQGTMIHFGKQSVQHFLRNLPGKTVETEKKERYSITYVKHSDFTVVTNHLFMGPQPHINFNSLKNLSAHADWLLLKRFRGNLHVSVIKRSLFPVAPLQDSAVAQIISSMSQETSFHTLIEGLNDAQIKAILELILPSDLVGMHSMSPHYFNGSVLSLLWALSEPYTEEGKIFLLHLQKKLADEDINLETFLNKIQTYLLQSIHFSDFKNFTINGLVSLIAKIPYQSPYHQKIELLDRYLNAMLQTLYYRSITPSHEIEISS